MTSPLDIVLEALRLRDRKPRGNGRQWSARCPSHDDGSPSLSITEGREAVVLLRCHAQCSQEDVLAALGLSFGDLYPTGETSPRDAGHDDGWVEPGVLAMHLDACHTALLSSADARLARRHLRGRGVTGEMVRHYRLGYGLPHSDSRLDWVKGRIVVSAGPRHVEGRRVDHDGGHDPCQRPDVKWLSAPGSRKRDAWWRIEDVDTGYPVVAVEGALDVLGLHEITGGNAVAVLGKRNASGKAMRRLAERGLSRLLLGLDADATGDEWKAFLTAGREAGIEVLPVIGPDRGDWGDLLRLDEDDYWPAASQALSHPVREVAA